MHPLGYSRRRSEGQTPEKKVFFTAGAIGNFGKYFRIVRGDTRRPSFTSNSLAIRSWPQDGFSRAILRIRRWSSGGIRGRPAWHVLRQNSWERLRCQPMKVLGVTTVNALRQLNQRLSNIRVSCAEGEVRWV